MRRYITGEKRQRFRALSLKNSLPLPSDANWRVFRGIAYVAESGSGSFQRKLPASIGNPAYQNSLHNDKNAKEMQLKCDPAGGSGDAADRSVAVMECCVITGNFAWRTEAAHLVETPAGRSRRYRRVACAPGYSQSIRRRTYCARDQRH
ncbi:hypothetical protein KCP78_23010 [Salmonella enterica subsp. enterica]|nr:hypothetical protein KCP78_23010 [Salmonella enterica subsp. enterica]